MKTAVFGVGGVGGLFGGRLAHSGEDVVFVASGEHLRAIRRDGLRVDSISGDFVVRPAQAADDPSEVGPVDVVLVAVKGWQVPEAAQAMRPLVGPETVVVPLLNGVEAPSQLAEALGQEHVAAGLCKSISFVAGPGHIRHTGAEPYIAFGEVDNRPSERIESLRRAFEKAGVVVEVPGDIEAALWDKFIFLAGLSGVLAVTRSPVGVV